MVSPHFSKEYLTAVKFKPSVLLLINTEHSDELLCFDRIW